MVNTRSSEVQTRAKARAKRSFASFKATARETPQRYLPGHDPEFNTQTPVKRGRRTDATSEAVHDGDPGILPSD